MLGSSDVTGAVFGRCVKSEVWESIALGELKEYVEESRECAVMGLRLMASFGTSNVAMVSFINNKNNSLIHSKLTL